jgi:hypothetical protein
MQAAVAVHDALDWAVAEPLAETVAVVKVPVAEVPQVQPILVVVVVLTQVLVDLVLS